MDLERVYVLGAGAIGARMAVAAHDAGWSVTLLLKSAESLRTFEHGNGIEFDQTRKQRIVRPDAEVGNSGTACVGRLLVTVKAQQTRTALNSIRHRLSPSSQIVFLQNGMGMAESVEDLLPPGARVVLGTTTEAAWRTGPFRLMHAARGETWFGPAPNRPGDAECVEPLLHAPGLNAGWDPDIRQRLWHKLALNCAINPLTALLGCRNGVLGTAETAGLLEPICREAESVLTAEGIHCATPLLDQARALACQTGANRSSMLQDVLAGRQTEIEHINGYLVNRAAQHGIPVPFNAFLLQAMRIRQSSAADDSSS